MDVERRRLPRHSRRPVGINGNRGLAILFVVLEAVSVVLDHVFGNSKWAPLAAFLLSGFGFAINIYACFLERRGRRRRGRRRRGSSNSIDDAIRSHSDRQLEIVEIVFSALQFIATLIHFILMISNVKSNYNVSVILPLAFAIIAVIFVFRKEENIENSLLEKKLEKMIDSFSNALGTASTGIRQLCQKLKGLASFKSAASRALKCLKFICEIDGGAGWSNVEKRFYEINAATNGVLPRARFGECIGMSEDSKGFSVKLFDAFARRRGIHGDTVTKDQIREFWDRINNKSLDSRLRTFFDMVDKDGNDRITEDEIREIICVNASANKFLNTQNKAEAFAAGIMEELDPDYLGYITINDLKVRLGFDSYPV